MSYRNVPDPWRYCYFERNPALDNLGLTPGTRSPDSLDGAIFTSN